ncbi:MAG: NAD(+)/NADH kinase [Deltaproteobacteria bacterium]|nr:NAD(+)/NADH kinase [Deltaproteobacteria bacterium]
MKPVGIIANPASGKDIRRLVAYGSVFDNNEKVNIVRRIILGLDSLGVPEVFFMPDFYGIGPRAMDDLEVSLKISLLDMVAEGQQEDSTLAARLFNEKGVGCIITLGGDGTNRAVAKGCGQTPLLPISTGTNNVFPYMVEGTLAGIAAGVAALHPELEKCCFKQTSKLEIKRDGEPIDLALVDVVVSKSGFVASRAVWEVANIKEIFLARAEPENIGFSSIGGLILGAPPGEAQGVHIVVGENGRIVRAPIAPGLIRPVPVISHRLFNPGEEIRLTHTPALIALDGERELIVKEKEYVTVSIDPQGPRVLDLPCTLRWAARHGIFIQ